MKERPSGAGQTLSVQYDEIATGVSTRCFNYGYSGHQAIYIYDVVDTRSSQQAFYNCTIRFECSVYCISSALGAILG